MVAKGDDAGADRAPSCTANPISSVSPQCGRKSARISLACSRCKRRKQICDGRHPVCGNCNKASTECIYERALRPQYPGGKTMYIKVLEERIAFLEARLPEHGQDHMVSELDHQPAPATSEDENRRDRRASCASLDSGQLTEEEDTSSLVDGVAYLSLCASGATGNTPEPFYLGSSSGATIARLIQSSIYKRTKPTSGIAGHSSGGASFETFQASSLSPSETGGNALMGDSPSPSYPVAPISRQHAQILFFVFFDRLQVRWPVLDRELFSQISELQWEPGASLSVVHRSTLHLVYAISARFLQLTRQGCAVDHEVHFAAAIHSMEYILEQHDVATVQFLTLLAIYGSRSPYGAGSWSQIRYAMTLCIELGLHRKQKSDSARRKDLEIRRRVFWACYCLDRVTTMTLGRTFAIADRDINVELPNEGPEFWSLTSASRPSEGEPHWPNVSQFTHTVRLRRLQSRVFRIVWRVDKDIAGNLDPGERSRVDQKVSDLKGLLDEWMQGVPISLQQQTQGQPSFHEPQVAFQDSLDYYSLQYNKTVLSLYSALLPVLPAQDPRFLYATQSAAAVCMAYKSLNAQKTLSYTIVALHDCFIAGLTLIYCLWRKPDLFDFDALEATRACSLCLTIFGEKWPGAVKYRDIFDATSGNLLRSVVGGKGRQPKTSGNPGQISPLSVDAPLPPQPYGMPAIPEATEETAMTDGMDDRQFGQAQHYGHAVYEAVRSAFTDYGEMGGNGWNGWRSFTEVVQSDIAMAPATMWTNDGNGGTGSFSFV